MGSYSPDWKQLRRAVLHRADHRCECLGECASHHEGVGADVHRCGAPQHAKIIRDPVTPALWWLEEDAPRGQLAPDERKVITVVLTIAHLCQDSTCGDLTHLRAMCARCHLVYDQAQHARNASATRYRQREAAGQLVLALTPERRPLCTMRPC